MDGDIALTLATKPAAQRAWGAVILGFRYDAKRGETGLSDLYHSHPMRVLFPRPARGDVITAAITTVSGGLVGGDQLDVYISVEEKAQVLSLAQAAEKVYRAQDVQPAQVTLSLTVGTEACLEYLPQETILFEGARLMRSTRIDLDDETSQVMAGEMAIFGRAAMGESVRQCQFQEQWRVTVAGKTIWRDAFTLSPAVATSPFGLDGATAMASLICVAPQPEALRDLVRPLLADLPLGAAGATVMGPLMLVRFLGKDPAAMRARYMKLWSVLRQEAFGRPARLPALIHC
ncbi:MAG: urease accessory protein UreD [Alphaproteobacteria bacterium]|nr:urease accessory protein UreD [Alphaproteobacteria bacterium]